LLGYTSSQLSAMMSMFTAAPTTVPSAPMARFAFKVSGNGLVVNVDGSASKNVSSYSWNCGGGTLVGSGAIAECDFATSGTFTISLTASGPAGSDTKSTPVYLQMNNRLPVAGFTGFTFSGNVASVTDASHDPDGDSTLTIFINWGDGTGTWTTAGMIATHPYNPGTYTIYLSANDGKGGNSTVKVGTVTPTNVAGTVSGVVSTPSATPIPGAIVTLYNGTTAIASAVTGTTPINGGYVLTNVPIGGPYTLKTRKGGYLFADVTIASVNAGANSQNVSSGAATLSGTIANSGNGVAVELRDSSCVVTLDAVISYGTYTFINVANSTTYCVVLPSGGTPNTLSVIMPVSGNMINQNLTYQ
ncbi:MAG: PKD domain-containing protein, partial [Nitrospirota bacterium]